VKIVALLAIGLLGLSTAGSAVGQTPLSLFNGTSLQGWNTQGTWTTNGGTLSGTGTGDRHALTAVPFGDINLQFEYNIVTPVGAKLRLWTTSENNGGLTIDLDNTNNAAGVGGVEDLDRSSISIIPSGWHRVQVEANHGKLRVRVDDVITASPGNLGSRAGYIGFEAKGNGQFQVRNIKVTPLNLSSLFNGNDLNGWKSVARAADAKEGMGHALQKTFSFGMAGGSTKSHDATWKVDSGRIHGESGPGGLENGTMMEDAIVQISAAVTGNNKPGTGFSSILLRNTPGQLTGGYSIGLGPFAGTIDPLVKRPPTTTTKAVDQTIIISGRTIAVWVGGNLTSVFTDTRAESANAAQGAKLSAGSMTVVLPNALDRLDLQKISAATLPKTFGMAAKSAPPPPPPTPPAVTQAAAAAPSAAETMILAQQQASAKKEADDEKNKAKVAGLMNQALSTNDPQQQMSYYSQVVQIDPSNAAAVQGYKEAQTKLQTTQTQQQQQQVQEQHQQQDAQNAEQQSSASLLQAQSSFLNGNFAQASTALSVAERLSPSNPMVRDLRSRISAAQSLQSRLFWLGGGVGIVALAGMVAMWIRRRRQHRYAVLEVTRGLESGKSYPLDRDLIRIGAVPQHGSQKNDIVIQDVEHAISRFHCEIARKNGQLYLTDLRSSNGTLINGEPVQPGSPALLRRGSKVTLANSVELRLTTKRRAKSEM